MAETATYIPKGRALVLQLGILMGCNFLGGFNESMMNIALVHVSERFGVTLSVANFAVVGFTIVAATAITVSAAALSRFGLRRVLFFALATCIFGCAVGFLAGNFALLVIARALQAFSVGVFFPTVTSVVMAVVGERRRGVVLSVNSAVIGVGVMCGPSASGLMLDALGLRGVFLVPGVLAVVLLMLTAALVRDVFARQKRKVDLPSIPMSFIAMAALMYGLGEVLENPISAICALAVGVCMFVLFVCRQLRSETPLLDLSPFKNKTFALGICVTLLVMMSESSASLILPLYFEGACGFGAGESGLLMIAPLATYAVMDVVAGVISDRRGVWPVVPLGFVFICIGVGAVFATADLRIAAVSVAWAALLFFGVGLAYPPTKVAELGALDAALVSNGSAINSCAIQVANSLGQAVFVGVMSANVNALMRAGVLKVDAYSVAFDQTLVISMAVGVLGLVLAYLFARRVRRLHVKGEATDD